MMYMRIKFLQDFCGERGRPTKPRLAARHEGSDHGGAAGAAHAPQTHALAGTPKTPEDILSF